MGSMAFKFEALTEKYIKCNCTKNVNENFVEFNSCDLCNKQINLHSSALMVRSRVHVAQPFNGSYDPFAHSRL